jgi:hypothetical protein
MELVFTFEKDTKNYSKYRQVDGINSIYLPKSAEGVKPVTKFKAVLTVLEVDGEAV